MPIKRDPSKILQVGFVALLSLCVLLVGYWVIDNYFYTLEVRRDIAMLTGNSAESDDTTLAFEELDEESASRINRYLWEGGFFLVVLLGGMTVLTRTIRHDAELRRRQQNFLAAVSHEFKSPLASMQLAAETLVLRSSEADSQRLGKRVLEDCERLLRMVDNLLDTTRLEEGRPVISPERTSFREVAELALAAVRERAENHGVSIHVDIDPELTLLIDRNALDTILRNLLDNAVKACIAGEGRRIDIEASRANGKLRLTVRDDGLGFPPEDAELMFEKFYRHGDELRRTTPGTGLGLYIVKRLAALSAAEVVATSAGLGKGAEMSVEWRESMST